MKISSYVNKSDKVLVAYRREDIIYVTSIKSFEELRYLRITDLNVKIILRRYNSVNDILEIAKDYEHNN